jgi:dipeptidyl aminopeptidase/acylaminoacyl peptidase
MRTLLVAALVLALNAGIADAATTEPDGTLLSSEPCSPNPVRSHADLVKSVRSELESEAKLAAAEKHVMPAIADERLLAALPSKAEVREHLAYRGFECRSIVYASGGLKVAGLLWKPINTKGRRLPLLLALRGGTATFGGMEPWRYWGWHDYLKAGFVVLSTQYRGGPGSEGEDGFGSPGDLDDVRNLVPLAASLGYVDTGRIFAHGGSRGGMQLYMLARSGLPLKAMAVRAGLADMRRSLARRPGLSQAPRRMTDHPADPEAALDRRSAALWAHEIKVPTILFHGTDDWRVPIQDAIEVAAGLHRAGTPFEAHFYQGDTHGLDLNQEDMTRRTLAFFRLFGAEEPTPAK